jgi:hypothetical protein
MRMAGSVRGACDRLAERAPSPRHQLEVIAHVHVHRRLENEAQAGPHQNVHHRLAAELEVIAHVHVHPRLENEAEAGLHADVHQRLAAELEVVVHAHVQQRLENEAWAQRVTGGAWRG